MMNGSDAYKHWATGRDNQIRYFKNLRTQVAGDGAGKRNLNDINKALCYLLVSQFQGYCQDVICEAASFIASCAVEPAVAQASTCDERQSAKQMMSLLGKAPAMDLCLSTGNPTFGSLCKDFRRVGLTDLKMNIKAESSGPWELSVRQWSVGDQRWVKKKISRISLLDELLTVRNAVVHGNDLGLQTELFPPNGYILMTKITQWDNNLTNLAIAIDKTLEKSLSSTCACEPDWS